MAKEKDNPSLGITVVFSVDTFNKLCPCIEYRHLSSRYFEQFTNWLLRSGFQERFRRLLEKELMRFSEERSVRGVESDTSVLESDQPENG